MTAVGKILVFFNLVFSVVVSAMIVLVYSTRTNWETEYNALKQEAQTRKAEYEANMNGANDRISARDAEVKNLQGTIAAQTTQIGELDADVTRLQDEKKQVLVNLSSEQAANEALVEEQKRLRSERDGLETRAEQQRNQIVNLTKQTNDERLIATQATIRAEGLAEKNENLLELLSVLRSENTQLAFQLEQFGGVPSDGGAASVLDPSRPSVPGNAHGKVKQFVEPNLLSVSIGSDSGIKKGAVLTVYRLEPPTYLGEVVISRADPKESVGTFKPATKEMPRPGDRVGTLTGGGNGQ